MQPAGTGKNHEVRRAPGTRPFRTQAYRIARRAKNAQAGQDRALARSRS